jgi:hypothetical protein
MASFTDEAGRPDTGGTSGRRDFMRKAAVVSTGVCRAHDHHRGCGGRPGTHQPTARGTRTAGLAPERRR